MSTVVMIPLSPQSQALSITLAGKTYNMLVRWCRVGQMWVLDIADVNDVAILNGVPLVTGADLLAQYPHLNFGGQLLVQTAHAPYDIPTYANLGIEGQLYFRTG